MRTKKEIFTGFYSRTIVVLFFLISSVCTASSIRDIKDVASRVAPWMNGKIITKEIPSSNGNDVFEISTKEGKLIIKANCVPAAGMGLNYYLKHFCKRHYSLVAENMSPIEVLPEITTPIRKETPFKYRHIFNFCTQNYSASFWSWTEWERMIDFMVLNGVNLTLATLGQEKVLYNTLKQFKFTEAEIMDYLPGPSFSAFHMMSLLQGWGGPVSKSFVDYRSDLEKKIVKRLRKYEISPIYPAYFGMVPSTMKDKYPEANIIDQGNWVGGFKRSDIVVPSDPLYKEIASVYYKEVDKLYGKFEYFAGEPFHEGGKRKGIDVSQLAVDVLSTMREFSEDAIWVLQGWSGNPSAEFLSRLSKEKDVLIWDFRGELWAEWETSKGYNGYPYFWGVINNYGDTPGLYGRLERFNNELFRAKHGPYGKSLQGLSVAPEGVLNNPVNFDFLYELAWNDDKIDVKEWIDNYVVYRYGKDNPNLQELWDILLQTAYSSEADAVLADPISKALPSIVGNGESILSASPKLDLRTCSSWGTARLFYDYRKMRSIIPCILETIEEYKDVPSYRYDIVDFTRQLISNEFREAYYKLNESIKSKDLETFNLCSERMLLLLSDIDDVLSTDYNFMLGRWVNMARDLAESESEKDLFEFNAKSVITYWGPDHANTDLRDYSFKEWGGLVREVHQPRWASFLNYHRNVLQGKKVNTLHNTQFAIDWAKKNTEYSRVPEKEFVETLKRVLENLQKIND